MFKNTALFLVSIIFSLYLCEIFLHFYYKNMFSDSNQKKIKLAKKMNIDFDERNRFEFFDDLKENNSNVYPYLNSFYAEKHYGLKSNPIISFGSISNITTMGVNESGYYPVIVTDEHGFNNSKGLYKKNINTILIGDSFVEGNGVRQNETMGAHLRKLKIDTLSIAWGGFGPLLELALLIEYAKPLEPKNVFWFYYEGNDYIDLIMRLNDEKYYFLKNYLYENNYSNNLFNKQEEIDNYLKSVSNQVYSIEKNKFINEEINAKNERISSQTLEKIIKLYNLRILLKLNRSEKFIDEYSEILIKILVKAKEEVENWDGKFYFVYLPSYYNVVTKDTGLKNNVLKIVERLEIPYLDIYEEVFKFHNNPTSLFPLYGPGHYNSQGYFEVANKVSKIIKESE